MVLNLKQLIVTQDELRNEQQICQMTEFVRNGGMFNQRSLALFAEEHGTDPSPLIKINKFEDGQLFIHDGHHRILSIYLGNRDHLLPEEYVVTRKSYQDYLDIVFEKNEQWIGWMTPHDVRTELRLPDIHEFKELVLREFRANGEQAAHDLIVANRNQFVKPRQVRYVHELSAAKRLKQGCAAIE